MRNCILFSLILLGLGFPEQLWANPPTGDLEPHQISCQNGLAALRAENSVLLQDMIHDITAIVERIGDGNFNGKKIHLQRVADSWFSDFNANWKIQNLGINAANAPLNDPRNFIATLGRETGKVFGFEEISDKVVTVPDANELAGVIAKINEGLPPEERLPGTFYSPPWGKPM